MSFGRSFTVGFLGTLGGLLVNILTNPASELAARFRLPLVPVLVASLLFVILVSAILQTLPSRRGSAPPQLQAQLVEHRAALGRLKERCLSEQLWTASCIEAWQEHQRSILALKRAFSDLGVPVKDDPIDIEPPPRIGCGLRLALLIRHTAALLAVPLVAFSVSYLAAFQLNYDRLNDSQLIARLLTPRIIPSPSANATPRASATPDLIARVSPASGTAAIGMQTVNPTLASTATAIAVTHLPSPTASRTPFPTQTVTPGASAPRSTATVRRTSLPPTTPPVSSLPVGCVLGRRSIDSPVTGQALERGIFQVKGSANSEPFQRYKLELGPGANPDEGEFFVLAEVQVPVTNGVLAEWNSATMPPGVYTLRLTVVKPDGNWFEPRCLVTFALQ